ncbi:MAG: LysR family transcriptional regulator [Burkholderiales bacterium]|nr:LysR family transcriptional regulator [Burkholderiales bacterium]
MNITLRQLRIFEAVARLGSISRAAAELHLTQPAVSMQMKQLESLLGLTLVEQVGKRLTLTQAGTELREHARDIALRVVDLSAAMDQLRGLERGQLRLAVVSTANYFLPEVIAEFSRHHPGVRISLQVANRESVLAALAANTADLAITGRPPDGADIVAQRFMDNPLGVIAPPDHPLVGQGAVPLARLARETLVLREPGSGTRAALERHFAAHGLQIRPGCELGTNEALKQAVRAGLGLGMVSMQTLELELATGCLVLLPVEGFPIVRQWYVVQRARKRLSAAAQIFRGMLLALEPGVGG